MLEDVNHKIRNDSDLKLWLQCNTPPGLSDADWIFSLNMAEFLQPLKPDALTELVVYYLHLAAGHELVVAENYMQWGTATGAIAKAFAHPLDKHLNRIQDEPLRLFCGDLLDARLRYECAMVSSLGRRFISPFVKWAESDVAANWAGGAWWELHGRLEADNAKMEQLAKSDELQKQLKDELAFASKNGVCSCKKGLLHDAAKCPCIDKTRVFLDTYRKHALERTKDLRSNLVFTLAQLGDTDRSRALKFAEGLLKAQLGQWTGRVALQHQAAQYFGYSVKDLKKHAVDPMYRGVLKMLFDDEQWAGVGAVASGHDIRGQHKACQVLWKLLWENFQFLSVGNAEGEYNAKMIKTAKVQHARAHRRHNDKEDPGQRTIAFVAYAPR